MLYNHRYAAIALASVLTSAQQGWKPSEDTINECRLAHSLLTDGEPTVDELEPFIGDRWVISRNGRVGGHYAGHRPVTPKQYEAAQIKAIAARLGLSEGRRYTCHRRYYGYDAGIAP